MVLGIPALIIVIVMYLLYRRSKKIEAGEITLLYEKFIKTSRLTLFFEAFTFNLLIGITSATMANLINICSLCMLDIFTLILLVIVLTICIASLTKYFIISYSRLINNKFSYRGEIE